MQPPNVSWGTIINDGQDLLYTRPWVSLAPGIMIVLTVLALNVLGDGVRDALDPRAKLRVESSRWTDVTWRAAVLTFIVRRTLWAALVMFVITVLVFVIFFKTPGVDPARAIAGRNPSPQMLAEIRAQFGLNRPLPIQYALMMKRIFITRDLVSYSNQGHAGRAGDLRGRAGHPVAGLRRRADLDRDGHRHGRRRRPGCAAPSTTRS